MGGRIDVTTEDGKGSCFHVELRLPEGRADATAPAGIAAGANDIDAIATRLGRPVRILVVEDNITNQVVTRGMLKSAAVTVVTANNGVKRSMRSSARHSTSCSWTFRCRRWTG